MIRRLLRAVRISSPSARSTRRTAGDMFSFIFSGLITIYKMIIVAYITSFTVRQDKPTMPLASFVAHGSTSAQPGIAHIAPGRLGCGGRAETHSLAGRDAASATVVEPSATPTGIGVPDLQSCMSIHDENTSLRTWILTSHGTQAYSKVLIFSDGRRIRRGVGRLRLAGGGCRSVLLGGCRACRGGCGASLVGLRTWRFARCRALGRGLLAGRGAQPDGGVGTASRASCGRAA